MAYDNPEDTLVLETTKGQVVIKLRPDLAPNHVARVKELAREGFYDGVVFHRVIDGFMAQTGDPTGTGAGGSDKPDLRAEFSAEPHKRGTVSAARTANPNSANSQFYICWIDLHCAANGNRDCGQSNERDYERDGDIDGHVERAGLVKQRRQRGCSDHHDQSSQYDANRAE